MRKVAVIGSTGSGKTTVARLLAQRLRVEHVELDALFWKPGWVMPSAEEFRAIVEAALDSDGWVADGNYRSRLGTVCGRPERSLASLRALRLRVRP